MLIPGHSNSNTYIYIYVIIARNQNHIGNWDNWVELKSLKLSVSSHH